MTINPVLKLTDGTTAISLLSTEGTNGIFLDGWLPEVADYKGGGIRRNNSRADGESLSGKQWSNVNERFDIILTGADQDAAITRLQDLRRLLEKASNYWTTPQQDEPVWIEASGSCETETRYSLVIRGRIPQDDNPHAQPFFAIPSILGNSSEPLALLIERAPWWLSEEPGAETCVQASAEQEGWEYVPWSVNTNAPLDMRGALFETSAGALLATDAAPNPVNGSVWRTVNGTAWVGNGAPDLAVNQRMAEGNGMILMAGTGGIYRSIDDGVSFVNVNVGETMAAATDALTFAASDGYFYYRPAGINFVRRSTDGAVWTDTSPRVGTGIAILYSDGGGNPYWLTSGDGLWRSTDGQNWTRTGGPTMQFFLELPTGAIVGYTFTGSRFYVSEDRGLTWNLRSTLGSVVGIEVYNGNVYAAQTNTIARSDYNVSQWETINVSGAAQFKSIAAYSVNDRLYAGESTGVVPNGDMFWNSDIATFGQEGTCANQAFVKNCQNRAQFTHVYTFDATGPTYTNQVVAATPFDIFPNTPAVGDILYLGIESIAFDSGPFCDAVFDLGQGFLVDSWSIVWEYSDGGAGWPALSVTDGTQSFGVDGVNSVNWTPPTGWAAEAVNGVTALWIRARISAIAGSGADRGPTQINRNIYTTNWPRVEIDDAQVLGDIPALLRIQARNRSDKDDYDTYGSLDLMENRMVVGLRSTSRGSSFVSAINLSDEQNPVGITVDDIATASTFINKIQAPTGMALKYDVSATLSTGLSDYETAALITIGPSVSDFYGSFQVYVRAQLVENTGAPVADADQGVQVRLEARTGTGGITKTTKHKRFTGWDKTGETFKDWQLIQLGRVNLPVSDLLKGTEQPNQFDIAVQVSASSALALDVNFYDLWLIPVDEWAGDFIDTALENDSGVGNSHELDIDSATFPKRSIRALVRSADSSSLVKATYQAITPGPAILQSNADQAIYFLTGRAAYLGEQTGGLSATILQDSQADFIRAGVRVGMLAYNTTTGNSAKVTVVAQRQITTAAIAGNWNVGDDYLIVCNNVYRSEPWNAHSIQLTANQRYLSFRGNR